MNITKWIKAIWKAMYFMIPTIYDIVEETKLWMQQKDQWLPGIRGEERMDRKWKQRVHITAAVHKKLLSRAKMMSLIFWGFLCLLPSRSPKAILITGRFAEEFPVLIWSGRRARDFLSLKEMSSVKLKERKCCSTENKGCLCLRLVWVGPLLPFFPSGTFSHPI